MSLRKTTSPDFTEDSVHSYTTVVDILIFYHGYRLLPEGLQSLLLSASFSVAALCYYSLMDSGNRQEVSLVIGLTLLLSFISLLETVIDNRLIKFCRSYFTILLASWLVHATRCVTLNFTWCHPDLLSVCPLW